MLAERQNLRELDWLMLGTVLVIAIGGVFAIHSAAHADKHAVDFVRKQGIGIVLGLVAMLGVALSDYGTLVKRFAQPLYYGNLVLLGIVLVGHLGHSSHGASRWIGIGPVQVQPSEFAKLILIGTLALFLAANIETIGEWRTVFRAFGHIAIPMLLIAKQPDLGTSLVILAIWFGMMAIGGAKPAHLFAFFLAGVLLFAVLWNVKGALKPYQKNRLIVFLKPDTDRQDTGYHLRQSEIAIGSGQLTGEGYGKGVQSNGRFIPEQHSDFIFTVVGEEGGFVTCLVLLALYLFVLERGIIALASCDDVLGRLLAAGVLTMLTFHVVVNVGMTMGVMPVVGVPLPFFSSGISSLLVSMASIGLLLSVAARRHRVMF